MSPEYFCDREKEAHNIQLAVTNGRNITLFSYRRLGKTGLIHHVFYRLKNKPNLVCIYIDLMPTQNLQDLIVLLSNSLLEQLETKPEKFLKKAIEFFGSLRPIIETDPDTGRPRLTFDLKKNSEKEKSLEQLFLYLSKQKKKIVIALDEFQQIRNYPEDNTEALLRTGIQKLHNTNFIFSGSQKHLLLSLFTEYGKPFYHSSDMLMLGKLDAETYSEFIKKNFTKNKMKISTEQIERILNWTRAHTYYTQSFCNRLWSRGEKTINENIITEEIQNIFDENEPVYINYRNLLTNYQWNVLRALAKEGSAKLILSKEFISKHKLNTASSVQTAIKTLLAKEMVYKEDDFYFVYDPFLERWLEQF